MFIPFVLELLHVPLLVIPQLMASRFGTPRFNRFLTLVLGLRHCRQ